MQDVVRFNFFVYKSALNSVSCTDEPVSDNVSCTDEPVSDNVSCTDKPVSDSIYSVQLL